jgi:uncharacterized protein YjfI (DUF2170 family)
LGIAHVSAITNTESPDALPVPCQKNPHMPLDKFGIEVVDAREFLEIIGELS